MMGGRVREILPANLRLAKPAGIAIVVAALSIWAYQTQFLQRIPGWFSGSSSTAAEAAPVAPQITQPLPVKLTSPAVKPAGRISAEFDTPAEYRQPPAEVSVVAPVKPETPAPVPAPADDPSPAPGGKAKHGIKSVGRFFHIGRKKPAEE